MTRREVAVDHAKLTPGPHTVLTEVEDAAGNTTTVCAVPFPKANLDDASPTGYERLRTASIRAWFVQGRIDTRRIQLTYRVARPGPISNRRTLSFKVTKKGKPFYLPGNRPKRKAS